MREILIFVDVHYLSIVLDQNPCRHLVFDDESEESGFMDMEFFYISFTVSYVSIVLCIATVLYINPHWRRAWFHLIEGLYNNPIFRLTLRYKVPKNWNCHFTQVQQLTLANPCGSRELKQSKPNTRLTQVNLKIEERVALLHLNENINLWVDYETKVGCCHWQGVQCSNTTDRVPILLQELSLVETCKCEMKVFKQNIAE
ncbi:Uncharacterized protein Fot_15131 [Forsythia ovata]|uniref:Leucine-rich repeat-containing N-terminal plant-type domain-containing protein n=1 Tax=Forsythia ovata TaxID=205694 RepID=A0ABD1WAV3_9LAMI